MIEIMMVKAPLRIKNANIFVLLVDKITLSSESISPVTKKQDPTETYTQIIMHQVKHLTFNLGNYI
jgi:hypothetical protein